MYSQQGLCRPSLRQDAAVADRQGIVLNPYLNGDACLIIVMHKGVIYCLTDAFTRERISFRTDIVTAGSFRLWILRQILRINQVHDVVGYMEERAFYRVLILQV